MVGYRWSVIIELFKLGIVFGPGSSTAGVTVRRERRVWLEREGNHSSRTRPERDFAKRIMRVGSELEPSAHGADDIDGREGEACESLLPCSDASPLAQMIDTSVGNHLLMKPDWWSVRCRTRQCPSVDDVTSSARASQIIIWLLTEESCMMTSSRGVAMLVEVEAGEVLNTSDWARENLNGEDSGGASFRSANRPMTMPMS